MNDQFTPGPWDQSHRKNIDGTYSTEVHCSAGKTIATIAWYPLPTTPAGVIGTYRGANARLIAAAPDLVAALNALLDQVDYTKGACSPADMVGACLDSRVIDKARAAIAKATGAL